MGDAGGLGEGQGLFRPGQGHVAEAALLLHALGGVGLAAGEDALVEAGYDHVGELQALGVVDGHELHGVLAVLPIPVRKEGHLGQEVLHGGVLSGAGLILLQPLQQLRDIVQPIPVPQLFEHLHVAALGEQVAQKLAHLHAVVVLVGPKKAHEAGGVGGGDEGIIEVVEERPVEAAPLLLGVTP